ncbi:MAG: hypothetical protein KF726_13945 [Anaerolineae bacterium]|nr:hypothetical protein [Anaerolineae bacterium]
MDELLDGFHTHGIKAILATPNAACASTIHMRSLLSWTGSRTTIC